LKFRNPGEIAPAFGNSLSLKIIISRELTGLKSKIKIKREWLGIASVLRFESHLNLFRPQLLGQGPPDFSSSTFSS
jgi:hypothetical protein